MPELLRVPYEPGTQSFECFKAKAFAGSQTENSPGVPICQASEAAVYHTTDNTSNHVVSIAMNLQISSDGQNWDNAGSPFTTTFDTITISSSGGNETVWNVLENVPTYATLARIQMVSAGTTIGCKVTVHAVIHRKTA